MAGNRIRKGRSAGWWGALLLCGMMLALIAGEVAARLAGVGDFPLYLADEEVGYIPAPSQQGAFLGRNSWAFNEHSMGVSESYAPQPEDIMLVGDSLVLGGNMIDQPDKLGPRLEAATNCDVWPLSAGSWGLRNELAALRRDPSLSIPQTLVLVLNSADFAAPSRWRSELTHPRSKPVSVLAYAIRKRFFSPGEPAPPPQDPRWRAELDGFLQAYPGRVIAVAYPALDELDRSSSPIPALPARIAVIDPRTSPGWDPADYADSIHPTASANAELAAMIASATGQCAA